MYMKQTIKIGASLLFVMATVLLAGCGSHDQNGSGPSGSQGTPPNVIPHASGAAAGSQGTPPGVVPHTQ